MQLKLVCTGLVAPARSRPTAFLEIAPSGVREIRSGPFLPVGAGPKNCRSAPADLIALKLTFPKVSYGHFRHCPFAGFWSASAMARSVDGKKGALDVTHVHSAIESCYV